MSSRIDKKCWYVSVVSMETCRSFVERWHYARGGSNTATYRYGLFKSGDIFDAQCWGVAWFIPPTKSAAIATYPENHNGVLALSRLVCKPDTPKNSCSFLLSRCMKLIDRERWPCLVTYADTWQGHTGAIYRAANWTYLGMTKGERCYVKGGRMVSRKAGPKTRTHSEMVETGAELIGTFAKHKFVHVA